MFKKVIAVLMVSAIIFASFATGAFAALYNYGDVTLDKKVNASDALLVLQIATGIKKPNDMQKALADVTADGKINSNDALSILMYATGQLKEFKKTDKNTLKATKVDPVISSKAYTIGVTMTEGTDKINCTFSSNGTDSVISAIYIGFEIRFLKMGGKSYIVVPLSKSYCEMDTPELIEGLRNIIFETMKIDTVYDKTTSEKVGLRTYTCETFYSAANASIQYYFFSNELKNLKLTDAKGNVQDFEFTQMKASADISMLNIPSHYKYDESLKNMFEQAQDYSEGIK